MSKPLTPHAAFPPGGVVIATNELFQPAILSGDTVPTDATAGYAIGALFLHSDGSAGTALYRNEGSATSCNFDPIETNAGVALSGLTATAAEINRTSDTSARVVAVAAASTALALTETLHAERLVLLPVITGAGLTITLPAATGTGNKYTIANNGVQTVSVTVTALAGDIMTGLARGWHLTAGANDAFAPTAADIKYTFNVTTTGGDGGDIMELWDVATDNWFVKVDFFGSGTLETGFA